MGYIVKTSDRIDVVRCKDCQYCEMHKDGKDFTCTDREEDFYAPYYSADTYYCASGIRRQHGTV